jgi:hypothetical protein
MVKSSSPNVPSTLIIFLCPRTHASPQTCHHSASSILTVRISCHVIAVFVFRKQLEEWRNQWIPTIKRLRYFFNKLSFLITGYVQVCMYDFYCKMCNNNMFFSLFIQRFDGKAWFFIVLSSLETVHDTVQYRYCIFSLLHHLMRIWLKPESLTFIWMREKESTLNIQLLLCLHWLLQLNKLDTM